MTNTKDPRTAPTSDGIRASDSDRDRIAALLAEALSEGRLTHDEHGERLEAAYTAKTLGELAGITDDLPGSSEAPVPGGSAAPVIGFTPTEADRALITSGIGYENITAVFGAAERKGRWLVEPRTNVSSIFGGIELDLREAVFSQTEVTVQCAIVLGGLEIVVPPGVRVVNATSAALGGVDTKEAQAGDGNGPTVQLTGLCLLGGIAVKTRLPGAEK